MQNIVIKEVIFMVKIFDIVDNGDMIYCTYTPENTNLKGTVDIDKKTLEIVNVNYSAYEYGKKMYVSHVLSKISEFVTANKKLPKELVAIWY